MTADFHGSVAVNASARASCPPPRTGGQNAAEGAAVRPGAPRPRQAAGTGPRPAAGDTARQLWAAIPAELAEKLRPLAGLLVADAIREVQRAVPTYNRPLTGKFREVLVGAIEAAVYKCFDNICNPGTPQTDWKRVFRYAGKVEYLEGRTLDALQTAVRVGARVVWRHISVKGREIGIPADTLFATADAIFAWVDELCTVAIEGYTEAQLHAMGALERRRRQLLKLVLSEKPVSQQSLTDLASTTDWPLPATVAVVALEYRDDQHQLPGISLGPEALIDLESSKPCIVVADPARHLRALQRELGDRRAAVGPAVPLADAHRSLACARSALTLVRRGILPPEQVTWCADHLPTLVLLADEFLVGQLAERALRPFADLTTKQRERLTATLLAWLETPGSINDVAARLDVHPQTVRYRMHQLQELLGDQLRDPDSRLALEIALRTRTLLAGEALANRRRTRRQQPAS
ncbi:PucR-like helix-turn-helix protein [Prauserella shujinwangii]|uniref:PucR-like helix-turn-helix protein n=1 Tax=Prauserella shujinwangii TaxID=1453103 RepID=A0A2T0LL18_9PSEU|nr:helix-turn-helix domain-containing protein [Prauserella shujinwangii]PRX43649.1 PucR-like helix-turn-helix protein [Prauserella shujinwangii]